MSHLLCEKINNTILNANCVFAACPAECDMGARRCFGNQPEDCCHFYDPGNSNKCLTECPLDKMVTDTFDCAGVYFQILLLTTYVLPNNALKLMCVLLSVYSCASINRGVTAFTNNVPFVMQW